MIIYWIIIFLNALQSFHVDYVSLEAKFSFCHVMMIIYRYWKFFMKELMNLGVNENVYNFDIWTCYLYHSNLRSKIYWFWENHSLLQLLFLLILFYIEYIQTFAIYILIEYCSNSSWFSLMNHILLQNSSSCNFLSSSEYVF